ncbi:MAG: putative molybdenum carrier protein [Gemmatimonadota bacterium]
MRAVVSGGQTGVDRAAFNAALAAGIPVGGWCPAARGAEDGPISANYPLRETFSTDPAQRTVWNVFDADATLIVAPAAPSGGTLLARETAERYGRPVLEVPPDGPGAERAKAWLETLPADVLLNVAGPRESEAPGIYGTARRVMEAVLGARRERVEPPRRVLVNGGAGCLGGYLIRLPSPGVEVHATQRTTPVTDCPAHQVDLADSRAVQALVQQLRPATIIHTAYGTGDPARDIVDATRNVANAALAYGVRLVHMSTDMVLDGEHAPFAESAEPDPVHEYGRYKAEAERYVRGAIPGAAVIRASLITAFHPPDPRSKWILAGLRDGSGPALFVDELRTPILAEDLARQIWEIARLEEAAAAGVWHLAGPEALSRYALGALVAAAHGMNPAGLRPLRSDTTADPRPRDLRLLTNRADRELPTRARALSEAVIRTP